jgi:hypothetical protein
MNLLKEWRREVGHGGVAPQGWRMAWYEPERRLGVYYPTPLHWLFRGLREFGYRLQIVLRAPRLERAQVHQMQRIQRERERLAEEYSKGYIAGGHECFQACLEAVEDEIQRVDETFDASSRVLVGEKQTLKN